ncbi:MAG: TrbC/VirB2 family protein [Patescibacteria group bacterium]
MNTLKRVWLSTTFTLASLASGTHSALAESATFGGPMPPIPGTPNGADETSIRDAILKVLTFVLNFLALLAVIFIIIAGIRLIVSQGEEETKEKAKKTILYVIIGLVVVLFARVIVGLFTSTLSNTVSGP